VNFDFSDSQKELQGEVHRFLRDRCDLSVAREVLDDENLTHASSLWRESTELGWCGVAIPEEYGGISLGYLELCVIAEEVGRSLSPVPYSSSIYQFAEALLKGGSHEQKEAFLPRVAGGELVGTLAFCEGPGFPQAQTLKAQFDSGRLTGEKWPVADAMIADAAVVLAADAAGSPCLCIVNLDQDGVSREQLASIDPTRNQGKLTFEGVEAEPLLQGDGDGWALFRQVLNSAAVLFSFEQIGGADACLNQAVAFASERHAFGRPIGAFQAVKHKLADVYVANQLARSNAYYGAWALATGDSALPLAAAVSRVSATSAYENAASESLQVHGGMGFTWEADCHLFLRRSRSLSLCLGRADLWKKQIAAALEQKVA